MVDAAVTSMLMRPDSLWLSRPGIMSHLCASSSDSGTFSRSQASLNSVLNRMAW
jgi:hypothetical protein